MTNVKSIAAKRMRIPKTNFDLPKLTEGQLNTLLLSRNYQMKAKLSNDNRLMRKAQYMEWVAMNDFDSVSLNELGFKDYILVQNNSTKDWPCMSSNYFNFPSKGIGNQVFQNWRDSELTLCARIDQERRNTSPFRFARRAELKKEYEACNSRVEYVSVLNSKLEGSAYQPLYNFLGIAGSSTGIVTTKSVLHKNFKGTLSDVLGLSRQTVDLWLENGIIKASIEEGAMDINPSQAIEAMREGGRVQGVGAPFLVVLPIVLKAITAALGVIKLLIVAFKQEDRQRIQAVSSGIGSKEWGAQESDWLGLQTANNDLLIPLLGLGAYFLIKK